MWRYAELWLLLERGAHFQKNNDKGGRKAKNGARIMFHISKYRLNGVGDIKISLKLCGIHFKTRSKKPPVAIIHIFARFFEVQLGRHGGDKRRKERTTER